MIKKLVYQHHIHIHIALIVSIAIVSAPVIFAFIISTQSPIEVFSYPPKLSPGIHYSNYRTAWQPWTGPTASRYSGKLPSLCSPP